MCSKIKTKRNGKNHHSVIDFPLGNTVYDMYEKKKMQWIYRYWNVSIDTENKN